MGAPVGGNALLDGRACSTAASRGATQAKIAGRRRPRARTLTRPRGCAGVSGWRTPRRSCGTRAAGRQARETQSTSHVRVCVCGAYLHERAHTGLPRRLARVHHARHKATRAVGGARVGGARQVGGPPRASTRRTPRHRRPLFTRLPHTPCCSQLPRRCCRHRCCVISATLTRRSNVTSRLVHHGEEENDAVSLTPRVTRPAQTRASAARA